MRSERELLSLLTVKLQELDPDVLLGHDIHGFGLEVLLQRFKHFKVNTWSRLGRLKRSRSALALLLVDCVCLLVFTLCLCVQDSAVEQQRRIFVSRSEHLQRAIAVRHAHLIQRAYPTAHIHLVGTEQQPTQKYALVFVVCLSLFSCLVC